MFARRLSLLCQARQSGWVTAEQERKLRQVFDQGLSWRQLLLGTGILTPEQWASLALRDEGRPEVKEDRLQKAAPNQNLFSFKVFWRQCCQEAEAKDIHQLRLLVIEGEVWRQWDDCLSSLQRVPLAIEVLPALKVWTSAPVVALTWELDERFTSVGCGLAWTRRSDEGGDHHPVTWTEVWQSFIAEPKGVCVICFPDPYLEKVVRQKAQPGWLTTAEEKNSLVWYDFDEPGQHEEILHRAWFGFPFFVTTHGGLKESWLEQFREAGCRVCLIERQQLSRGESAWQAHVFLPVL